MAQRVILTRAGATTPLLQCPVGAALLAANEQLGSTERNRYGDPTRGFGLE